MTPLALVLSKELITTTKRRSDFWRNNAETLRQALCDTHFFETTEIMPMIDNLFQMNITHNEAIRQSVSEFGFLPATKTWLEWNAPQFGGRMALLLEEISHSEHKITYFCRELCQHLGESNTKDYLTFRRGGDYYFSKELVSLSKEAGLTGEELIDWLIQSSQALLVIINSPKIIGRRQYMPHREIERRLTRQFGVGKFPLHAWTELRLHVAKPIEIDDGEPHEAHLTGRRALHFCRKHIRIRLGRLEYVSAHWRGDPAIGIKQSRYKVEP